MALTRYNGLLHDGYQIEDALPPSEYNALTEILDTQLQAALASIGGGIVEGLAVSGQGDLTAHIDAGRAILEATGASFTAFVAVQVAAADTVDLPDGEATLYLWLQAYIPDDSDYDSRVSGACRIAYTTVNAAPANSLPLALGSTETGVFVLAQDLRQFAPARAVAAFEARVAAVEATVVDHEARLTAQENTGGSETGGYRYYRDMPLEPGDETTPPQLMDKKLADHVTALHGEGGETATGDTIIIEPNDTEAVNQALALLQDIETDNVQAGATQIDCMIIVPMKWGDGSNGSPDFVDRVNSTWTTGLAPAPA